MKKSVLIFAIALILCHELGAADAGKQYFKLKDNSDFYVGEGVAETKEFGGDGLKALAAAKERAHAALASSISVRITSETREESSQGKAGSTEEIQSKTQSLTDIVLENVRDQDFVDFPEKGKVTALAMVSKEDYRRQLAGKSTPVYRPEYGIKLGIYGLSLPSFLTLEDSGPTNGVRTDFPMRGSSPGSSNSSGGGGGNSNGGSGLTAGFSLGFVWRSFTLSLDHYSKETPLYIFDPKAKVYDLFTDGLSLEMVGFDWQWIPWNWRVQPFVPVGISGGFSNWYQYQAVVYGANAGLGLRYWPSDAFSLEFCVRYLQGLNTATYMKEGKPLLTRPGQEATLSATGAKAILAMQWSGF